MSDHGCGSTADRESRLISLDLGTDRCQPLHGSNRFSNYPFLAGTEAFADAPKMLGALGEVLTHRCLFVVR